MEEGDIVLCTVTKIEGTSVFVNIEGDGEGSIVVSEIAPGRIRNLRDYVVPNKKIVCKVLKIEGGHVHLSLRRVTGIEKQAVVKKHDALKAITITVKRLFPEKFEEIIQNIQKKYDLVEFIQEAKANPSLLDAYFDAEGKEKISVLLREKADRGVEIKKELKLKCVQSNGLSVLKHVLTFDIQGLEISYLAASRFVLKLKAQNYKEGNAIINKTLEEIQKRAKKGHCEFEILEK